MWQEGGPFQSRAEQLVASILSLSPSASASLLDAVLRDFGERHLEMRDRLRDRFASVAAWLGLDTDRIDALRQLLIGSYFLQEYSHAAAAVMNPSVIVHPDQSDVTPPALRILLSLRTVGEGHVSSIAFREGILANGELHLEASRQFASAAEVVGADGANGSILVRRRASSDLAGTVLCPFTQHQMGGMENLRLLPFVDDAGDTEWLGTYTAHQGPWLRVELLRTRDWRNFELVPMTGAAARRKGIALFPRKLAGQYAALGQLDDENLFLLTSNTLLHWEDGVQILSPAYPWDFVQIGNCGPPIELAEGWLVITHGIGAMRKYSIGAALLDKINPQKVIGRTTMPLFAAADQDRNGYVPNVVFSCGALVDQGTLFLPFGVADSSVAFAFVPVDDLLARM